MIEGWGLLGDTGWIAPPANASSAWVSLSAFWDSRDRSLYLAELGERAERGGATARSVALSTVDDKGARTPVSSTYVHTVESRICRSAGDLWLTGDQPQAACHITEAGGAAGVKSCEPATDAPAGGLLCANVISNVVPGAVLTPDGRKPVNRPPTSLVPDANVALRTSMRLLLVGGTLPDFTWWSPAPNVIHAAGDGWLRFSARSVRGDPGGMEAQLLDASGQVVRAEATVFDMAQLPAHVLVLGDDVLAFGITPVLTHFRLPSLERVDRPEPIPRVRARLSALDGSPRLIEGALAVLLAAPPLLLFGLACSGFRGGLAFAKRLALLVLIPVPVLIELVQKLRP
jgi:hypothetical protein